jgi:hypothetical protein
VERGKRCHTGSWAFTLARYFFRKGNYVIENVAIKVLLIAGEIELRAHLAAGTLCNQQEASKVRGTAAFAPPAMFDMTDTAARRI